MSYHLLDPKDVQVFPFGKTRRTDLNARVLNEQNITNLVRMLTDKKSYVVNFDETTHIVEFVVNGYYFKTDLTNIWENFFNEKVPQNVYAYILLNNVDNYAYLLGGDAINTVAEGAGTSNDPFRLVKGRFETTIHGDATQDFYYMYTFDEDGTLVIHDNDNIVISSIQGNPTTDSGKVIFEGDKSDVIKFSVRLAINKISAEFSVDVLYSAKFDGITFTTDEPSVEHKLHLFAPEGDGLIVPSESFLKFNERSLDVTLKDIESITCGTAADFFEENL